MTMLLLGIVLSGCNGLEPDYQKAMKGYVMQVNETLPKRLHATLLLNKVEYIEPNVYKMMYLIEDDYDSYEAVKFVSDTKEVMDEERYNLIDATGIMRENDMILRLVVFDRTGELIDEMEFDF